MLNFRSFDFSESDYQTMYDILKTIWPDSGATIEGMKSSDNNARAEKFDFVRLMAEMDGRVVGYGFSIRELDIEEEGCFFVGFNTLPDYRKRGIASAFLDKVENELLVGKGATNLLAYTRDTQDQSMSFLENRGFKLTLKIANSEIDLREVDLSQFDPLRQKLAAEGIQIRPLSELMDEEEKYVDQLNELHWMLVNDEPHAEPPKPISNETFKSYYIDTPHFYPEGWFIATYGDKFVGWSAILIHKGQDDRMQTGITVIDRSYRRKGLATAMKVVGFEHALKLGRPVLQTENAEGNPMLDLNKQLGFRETYQGLDYKKAL